jgi:hypothetical protein
MKMLGSKSDKPKQEKTSNTNEKEANPFGEDCPF